MVDSSMINNNRNMDKLFHLKSASLKPVFLNTSIQNGLQASFKRLSGADTNNHKQHRKTNHDSPIAAIIHSGIKTYTTDSLSQANRSFQS